MSSPERPAPPTNDVIFPALRSSIRAKRCIAVIGAGMSAGDYPMWTRLISELQERCELRSEDSSSTDPLDVAQAAKEKNASAYFRALDETFARKASPVSLARYHLLARVEFASYITLNFDPLLVDTLDLHGNVTVSDYPNLQSRHHGNREIFSIHGRLGPGRPASSTPIVLTRREFEDAYDPYGSAALHSFIHQTFLGHDVCFLGCNPAEPHLAKILESCKRYSQVHHGLTGPSRPNWYLLADEGYERLDRVEDCGIYPVRFSRLDSRFSGLDQILEYFAGKKPPFLRPPGVQESKFDVNVEPDR